MRQLGLALTLLAAGCVHETAPPPLSGPDQVGEGCAMVGRPPANATVTEMNAAQAVCFADEADQRATAQGPPARCDAAPAQGLVGRSATPELAREAQRLSGARVWRWLRPGQIVTMEFRADRLNIRLDARDKVEGLSCG